jgi:hypothetical protein
MLPLRPAGTATSGVSTAEEAWLIYGKSIALADTRVPAGGSGCASEEVFSRVRGRYSPTQTGRHCTSGVSSAEEGGASSLEWLIDRLIDLGERSLYGEGAGNEADDRGSVPRRIRLANQRVRWLSVVPRIALLRHQWVVTGVTSSP